METTTSPGYENLVAENVRLKTELAKIYVQREAAQAEMSEMEDELTAAREELAQLKANTYTAVDFQGRTVEHAAKEKP